MSKNKKKSAPNPLKADPSRTAGLRRAFERAVKQRMTALKRAIREFVDKQDSFGLRPAVSHSLPVYNDRFRFKTTAQKVEEFRKWLEQQADFQFLRNQQGEEWWRRFVEEGYRKGAGRVWEQVRKPALTDKDRLDFYRGTREEFLRSTFANPTNVDRVNTLAGRVFTELKAITAQIDLELTRELTDGLAQGKSPRIIASDMEDAIDGITKKRALVIARTEIIRTHAEGQLDALEAMGMGEVGVEVEWTVTADSKLCDRCAALSGVVMTIDEARGLLPRHPNCRCAFIPANVGEDGATQKRSKSDIEDAIDESLLAEAGKNETLDDVRDKTTWTGADAVISKTRPSVNVKTLVGNAGGDCGAGVPGAPGFQPGNSCGSKDGSVAGQTPFEKNALLEQAKKDTEVQIQIDHWRNSYKASGEFISKGWDTSDTADKMRANKPHTEKLISKIHGIKGAIGTKKMKWEKAVKKVDALMKEAQEHMKGGDIAAHNDTLLKVRNAAEEVDSRYETYAKARDNLQNRQREIIAEHIQERLAARGMRPSKITPVISDELQPKARAEVDKAMEWIQKVTPGGMPAHVTIVPVEPVDKDSYYGAGGRAYHRSSGTRDGVQMAGTIYVPERVDAATVVHEFGHHLEGDHRVWSATEKFLWHRVGDEEPVSMAKEFPDYGYHHNEMGRGDDFGKVFGDRASIGQESDDGKDGSKPNSAAYYVGKFYPHGGHEVLSMGIEQMYRNPVRMMTKDPEYFHFVVGVLDGSIL